MCPRITAWLQVQMPHGASGPFLRSAAIVKGFLGEAWCSKVHSGRSQGAPTSAKSPWLEQAPLSGAGGGVARVGG